MLLVIEYQVVALKLTALVPFQLNLCILICNSYNIQYKKDYEDKT
jgi:hypothetical protein